MSDPSPGPILDLVHRNAIVLANQGLVWSIARTYTGHRHDMEIEDIVQIGNIALIKAAAHFDAAKGFSWSTYAHAVVDHFLRREISEGGLVRVPRAAMAAGLNAVTTAARRTRATMARRVDSIDVPRADAGDDRPWDLATDAGLEATAVVEDAEAARQVVEFALARLDARARAIVLARWGIGGGEPLTLHAIGALHGCSWETIRKLHLKAVRAMRDEIIERYGKDFDDRT